MLANIVGGSYQGKYIEMNAQKTINYYIQKDMLPDEDSKFKQALLPFPGLTTFLDLTNLGQPCRAQTVARTQQYEKWFVVVDNFLYEILDQQGNYVNYGQMTAIPNDNTPVFLQCNNLNQLLIANKAASYCYDIVSGNLSQITDTLFTSTISTIDNVAYTEGYILITSNGSVFYNLGDITDWSMSGFFTPGAHTNRLVAAYVWRDDIYCFCQESVEIYINDGTPFSKQVRNTMDVGLVSPNLCSVYHEGLLFVGKTATGQKRIFFYNGLGICTPVSTSGIEWQINNPSQSSNPNTWDKRTVFWNNATDTWNSQSPLEHFCSVQYSIDGHIFFYYTNIYINTTYVFDTVTKEWIERQSVNPNTTNISFFRGTQLVNFKGSHYWLDYYTGKIFEEDFTVATEDGNTITRIRIGEVFSQQKVNISVYEVELDCTVGVGVIGSPSTAANIAFSYSRDGGETYSTPVNLSTGSSGAYNKRTRKSNLGTARNWVFKFVQTDAAYIILQAAFIHGIVDSY